MSDETIFYDPAVILVIRAVLMSKGIRYEEDLKEATNDVVADCIEHCRETGLVPETVEQATPIARTIADRHGSDLVRKRINRGKTNVGPTEKADEHAREPEPSPDPVDEGRMLGSVQDALPQKQVELLSDVAKGARYAELAAERNTSEAALRKEAERARRKARNAMNRNT